MCPSATLRRTSDDPGKERPLFQKFNDLLSAAMTGTCAGGGLLFSVYSVLGSGQEKMVYIF